mmetsp:Transcript_15472/g.60494  ORF Transcript_15472/g.60494 Transcript_15472/m.60494 type:complete len:209 (+) Transcript_15472:492-1118(+)
MVQAGVVRHHLRKEALQLLRSISRAVGLHELIVPGPDEVNGLLWLLRSIGDCQEHLKDHLRLRVSVLHLQLHLLAIHEHLDLVAQPRKVHVYRKVLELALPDVTCVLFPFALLEVCTPCRRLILPVLPLQARASPASLVARTRAEAATHLSHTNADRSACSLLHRSLALGSSSTRPRAARLVKVHTVASKAPAQANGENQQTDRSNAL